MLALTWLCPHGDAVGMELGGVGTEVYKIWGGRLSKKEHKNHRYKIRYDHDYLFRMRKTNITKYYTFVKSNFAIRSCQIPQTVQNSKKKKKILSLTDYLACLNNALFPTFFLAANSVIAASY